MRSYLKTRLVKLKKYSYKDALGDKTFKTISFIFAIAVIVILFALIISIFLDSIPALNKFGIKFFFSTTWSDSKHEFGALSAIYGSIVGALIAMILSIPMSIGVTIYLTQIAGKKMRLIVGVGIELLAAIPSIVYGMVGLLFLVPFLADLSDSYGMGILSAGIVLSVMVLPFMAALMRDSIDTTPDILKESAYALGTTKLEVIKDVLFPYAKVGIIGSIILALSRVLGETMAVTFLIGGSQRIPSSLFEPATNIPSTIAINFGEADNVIYTSSLFYLALVLLVINCIIIFAAKWFMNKNKDKE